MNASLYQERHPGTTDHFLSASEIAEAIGSDLQSRLFIGGFVHREAETLILYRADLARYVVPFSWFTFRPVRTVPDFGDFEIVDGGNTIRLGSYEAAADAIIGAFEATPIQRGLRKP